MEASVVGSRAESGPGPQDWGGRRAGGRGGPSGPWGKRDQRVGCGVGTEEVAEGCPEAVDPGAAGSQGTTRAPSGLGWSAGPREQGGPRAGPALRPAIGVPGPAGGAPAQGLRVQPPCVDLKRQ